MGVKTEFLDGNYFLISRLAFGVKNPSLSTRPHVSLFLFLLKKYKEKIIVDIFK
jgi:hypothetical protein